MKLQLFDALIREKYGVTVYDYDMNAKVTIIQEMREWCSATFSVNHLQLK